MPHLTLHGLPDKISASETGVRLVVIGSSELAGLPTGCRFRLIPAPMRLSRLTAEWLAGTGARAIMFALFAQQPDAWQICGHLTRTGFAGRLIALSPVLPNRRMVERELRAEHPALRLQVMPVLQT